MIETCSVYMEVKIYWQRPVEIWIGLEFKFQKFTKKQPRVKYLKAEQFWKIFGYLEAWGYFENFLKTWRLINYLKIPLAGCTKQQIVKKQ